MQILFMNKNTFTYIPNLSGEPMLVHLGQHGEVNVTIGDSHQGSLVQDDGAEFGWRTEDPLLQEILPDLSLALKEREAMENLPYALKQIYPGELIAWDWTEDENLKLIAHPETDLKIFAEMIRNQVNEVVLFEKDLILYLGKEGSLSVEEIRINA